MDEAKQRIIKCLCDIPNAIIVKGVDNKVNTFISLGINNKGNNYLNEHKTPRFSYGDKSD